MLDSLALIREIDALGQRWVAWRQEEPREWRAIEQWYAGEELLPEPEIAVGPEAFQVAGEVMICRHPACCGFVRGLVRCANYVYWLSLCHCPTCGQRYQIRPS